MKKIIIPVFTLMFALSSCSDWVTPESLDYSPLGPSEKDPAAYAEYLSAIRAYKQTEHNVMIVGIEGTSEKPQSRPQHLTNMPDSADFIFIKDAANLNAALVSEIAEVRQNKGTRTLLYVDFDVIETEWKAMDDARTDAGLPLGTEDEAVEYFGRRTEELLADYASYGFDGAIVSFEGNTSGMRAAMQTAFLGKVSGWHKSNPEAVLMLRGTIRNIEYTNPDYKALIDDSKYLIVVSNDDSVSEVEINKQVTRILAYVPVEQRKVVFEVMVPTADSPAQSGASPQVAAGWVLAQKNSKLFSPLGVSVSNAHSDYYNQSKIYKNVREAISIMNPDGKETE